MIPAPVPPPVWSRLIAPCQEACSPNGIFEISRFNTASTCPSRRKTCAVHQLAPFPYRYLEPLRKDNPSECRQSSKRGLTLASSYSRRGKKNMTVSRMSLSCWAGESTSGHRQIARRHDHADRNFSPSGPRPQFWRRSRRRVLRHVGNIASNSRLPRIASIGDRRSTLAR